MPHILLMSLVGEHFAYLSHVLCSVLSGKFITVGTLVSKAEPEEDGFGHIEYER